MERVRPSSLPEPSFGVREARKVRPRKIAQGFSCRFGMSSAPRRHPCSPGDALEPVPELGTHRHQPSW